MAPSDRRAEDLRILELLYDAAREPVGLTVTTNSAHRLRQRMYAVRKGKPELEHLSFELSPVFPETELWIRNNGQAKAD